MITMRDIPNDIKKAAFEACSNGNNEIPSFTVAKAILAERERCAKIAIKMRDICIMPSEKIGRDVASDIYHSIKDGAK